MIDFLSVFGRKRRVDTGIELPQALLFHAQPVNPIEIISDAEWGQLPDAPPTESGYRDSEIQGIACWNCGHDQTVGDPDGDGKIDCICHLWETKCEALGVCDRFTADPTLHKWDNTPHEGPSEGDGGVSPDVGLGNGTKGDAEFSADKLSLAELFLPHDGLEFAPRQQDNLIVKPLLREGEWTKTPGSKGIVRKPLRIVRDGQSSLRDGVLSLEELRKNFEAGAYKYVQVPLSEIPGDDHLKRQNMTKANKGFVKRVWIEDDEEGRAILVGGLHMTDSEADRKIKDGTFADASAGVYFNVENPKGDRFNAALNHVVITNNPFATDVGGFQFADGMVVEQGGSYVPAEDAEGKPDWDDRVGLGWRRDAAQKALSSQLGLSNRYAVGDISDDKAVITENISGCSWVVGYRVVDDSVRLSPVEEWTLREGEGEQGSVEPDPAEADPAPASSEPATVLSSDPLEQARQLRGLRLSQTSGIKSGGSTMSRPTNGELGEIDFSNEDAVRAEFVRMQEELRRARRDSSESAVEARVAEISGMGFSNAPGFLRVIRDYLVSDDGEPAAILLSHDDHGNEIGRRQVTVRQIIDDLVGALPTDEKGKVLFADLVGSGNHENSDPPPNDDPERRERNEKDIEDATLEVAESLYGRNKARRLYARAGN